MEIIEAFAAKNKCYQVGAPLYPQGLMLHSIGTPQPSAAALARYFDQYQPGGQSVCVHAFVQADGTVYQTLPWETIAWHCGAVNTYSIGVEIIELSTEHRNDMQRISTNLLYITMLNVICQYLMVIKPNK